VDTNHISETAEARVFKFCKQVGYVKSQQTDDKSPYKKHGQSHVTYFKLGTPVISMERLKSPNFAYRSTLSSPSLRMKNHPQKGRGQCHITHFTPATRC